MKAFRPTIPPAPKSQAAKPVPPAPGTNPAHPALTACGRWEGTDLILCVKVHPRGGKFGIGRVVGDALRIKVASPPEDGRATEELLAGLARTFGVRLSCVTLIHGAFTPQKLIRISRPAKLPPELMA